MTDNIDLMKNGHFDIIFTKMADILSVRSKTLQNSQFGQYRPFWER